MSNSQFAINRQLGNYLANCEVGELEIANWKLGVGIANCELRIANCLSPTPYH